MKFLREQKAGSLNFLELCYYYKARCFSLIRKLDNQNETTAKAIQDIQRPAYGIEAELMGFDGIPQLKETLQEIRDSEEEFVGYVHKGQLLGFISYKKEGHIIDIYRLVVQPAHFRQGIGRQLLSFLMENFQGMDFLVSTGKANVPAKKLYAGF